jgi:hypothetical protein
MLARAFPVKPGEIWSTGMTGIPFASIRFRFG